jgi:CRP-like cAMP-binding protein
MRELPCHGESVPLARPFLAGLSEADQREILHRGTRRCYNDRYPLIEEGTRSDEAFILLDGRVKVLKRTGRDGHALLGFRRPGDVLGEMTVLDEAPRSATVVACGDIVVQRIDGASFREVMNTRRAARQAVERTVVDRLRMFMARMASISGISADLRILRVLAELSSSDGAAGGDGRTISFLTHSELAATAGCSEAMVRKVLAELERTGVVIQGYGAITISDQMMLGRLANQRSLAGDSPIRQS